MTDIIHRRSGSVISSPEGFEELEFTKDFIGRQEDVGVSVSDLVFKGEEAVKIIERANSGVGYYEGDHYEIEVKNDSGHSFIKKFYLDYSDDLEIRGCNEVKVSLKTLRSVTWLEDKADFSFRYLYDIEVIKNADFVRVPYLINLIPDGVEIVTLGISIFIMTKELVDSVRRIAKAVSDAVNAATPVTGVGVGLGAVAVVAWDIGDIIAVAINIAIDIAYTIGIVIAIRNLAGLIFDQLLPSKRYHLGMSVKTLFKKGCEHLGLTLESSILDNWKDMVLIPPKENRGGEAPEGFVGDFIEKGVPVADSEYDTFGGLIESFKDFFNADYKIIDGVFQFERRDFWDGESGFVIDDNFTDQELLRDVTRVNSNELLANYNILFATDNQDRNTLINQEGRVFQAVVEPVNVIDQDLVTLRGLDQRAIGLSLGLAKQELNNFERVLKTLGGVIDRVTSLSGGGTAFASRVEDRKGSLLLSSDYTTVTKAVWMDGSSLELNQRGFISSDILWSDFHYINSFVEIEGVHNQYTKYQKVKTRFCLQDFLSLLENNRVTTSDGKKAIIELLNWKAWEGYAEIDYRVNEKHTDNLQLRIVK